MLTTIAWDLGTGSPTYALEGSIFVTGAAIQWLRDGLGIISSAPEVGPLAATVPDSGGVVIVPAFTGLGSPWWDPYARGTICGLTRGSTAAHLARATIESMAFQTRDVIDAMTSASGIAIEDLRVDGGAAVMDLLLQFQADQLGVTVRRRSTMKQLLSEPLDSLVSPRGSGLRSMSWRQIGNSMQSSPLNPTGR